MSGFVDIEDMAWKHSSSKPLRKGEEKRNTSLPSKVLRFSKEKEKDKKMEESNRDCLLFVAEESSAWSELDGKDRHYEDPLSDDDIPELEKVDEIPLIYRPDDIQLIGKKDEEPGMKLEKTLIHSGEGRESLSLMNTMHVHLPAPTGPLPEKKRNIHVPMRAPDVSTDEIIAEINAVREKPATKEDLREMSDQVGSLADSFSRLISGRKSSSSRREGRLRDRVAIIYPGSSITPMHQERGRYPSDPHEDTTPLGREPSQSISRGERSGSHMTPPDPDTIRKNAHTYMQSSIFAPESMGEQGTRVYTAKESYDTLGPRMGSLSEIGHNSTTAGRDELISRGSLDVGERKAWEVKRNSIFSKRSIHRGRSILAEEKAHIDFFLPRLLPSSPSQSALSDRRSKSLGSGKTYIGWNEIPIGSPVIVPAYGPLRSAPGHEWEGTLKNPNVEISQDEDDAHQRGEDEELNENEVPLAAGTAVEFDAPEGMLKLPLPDAKDSCDSFSDRDEEGYADDAWFSQDKALSDSEIQRQFDEAISSRGRTGFIIDEAMENIMEEDREPIEASEGGRVMSPIVGVHKSVFGMDLLPDDNLMFGLFRHLQATDDSIVVGEPYSKDTGLTSEKVLEDEDKNTDENVTRLSPLLSPTRREADHYRTPAYSQKSAIGMVLPPVGPATGEVPSPPADLEPFHGELKRTIIDWEQEEKEKEDSLEKIAATIKGLPAGEVPSPRDERYVQEPRFKLKDAMMKELEMLPAPTVNPGPDLTDEGKRKLKEAEEFLRKMLREDVADIQHISASGKERREVKSDPQVHLPGERKMKMYMHGGMYTDTDLMGMDDRINMVRGRAIYSSLNRWWDKSGRGRDTVSFLHPGVVAHQTESTSFRRTMSDLTDQMVEDGKRRKGPTPPLLVICPKGAADRWKSLLILSNIPSFVQCHPLWSMINIPSLIYSTPSPVSIRGTYLHDIGNLLGRGQKRAVKMMLVLIGRYQVSERRRADGRGWIYALLTDHGNHSYSTEE